MRKAWQIFKHELKELIPPTAFFFVAIGLLMLTKRLILKQYGIGFSDFAAVLIGALVVGKVVLIVDCFKFVNRYLGKPLSINVFWKTAIYTAVAFIVRIAKEIVPKLLQHSGIAGTIQHLAEGIVWPHFLDYSSLASRLAVRLLCHPRAHPGCRQGRSRSHVSGIPSVTE